MSIKKTACRQNYGREICFGEDFEIIYKAHVAGQKVGADRRFWNLLANSEPLLGKVVKYVKKKTEPSRSPQYLMNVTYSRSIEKIISESEYCWRHDEVNVKNFPIRRRKRQDIVFELVHFNYDIAILQAKSEIEELGLRPAELAELLAFGKAYPDLQKAFPVMALGSIRYDSGGYLIPTLCCGKDGGRTLKAIWQYGLINPCIRFAAIQI